MNTKTNSTKWSWTPQNEPRAARTGWLLLLLLLALPAVGQAQFTYTINNGTVTITRYTGLGGVVTIPDTINGLPVTSIGNSAFRDFSDLTGVTIPRSLTNIESLAFYNCTSLASVNIPYGVTSIGEGTFYNCLSLTSVTIPNSVTSIASYVFSGCANLTNVSIPDSITSMGIETFYFCTRLTSVTIGTNLTRIGTDTFYFCTRLTNVTIGNSVTSIGDRAFYGCTNPTGVYFEGNAPSLGTNVCYADNNAVVYYHPGTSGWGTTFGGRPAWLWSLPAIRQSPPSQTAEAGSVVRLGVNASGAPPLSYLWYFNYTNLISWGTNSELELTNLQFAQSGAYTVVITNVFGAITSPPAMLQVIAPVERRLVPGVKLTGEASSLLNVDYADSLSATPLWTTLGSVSLTSTSQYYFDLTLPFPPQRCYRAWQTGGPGVIPFLLDLHMVPAITLTGNIGGSVRVDYINQFGPTNAWVTLDTVTLTNTSQLYFDVSVTGQPQRLYRLLPGP